MRGRSTTIQAETLEEFIDISIAHGLQMEANCRRAQRFYENSAPGFQTSKLSYYVNDSYYNRETSLLEMEAEDEDDTKWDNNQEDMSYGSVSTAANSPSEFEISNTFYRPAVEKAFVPPKETIVAKTMVVGAPETAKHQFINKMFDMENTQNEVKNGFDLIIRNKETENCTQTFKVWIQDPTCRHNDALLQVYYRSINHYVFIYKVTDRESFTVLDQVIAKVKAKAGDKFKGMLIGEGSNNNLMREVTFEEGETLSAKHQLDMFLEDSFDEESLKESFFEFHEKK